jgi:hypothetical protein
MLPLVYSGRAREREIVIFASFLIIGVSLVLFAYWFRYTCLLILHTRRADAQTGGVDSRIRLSYQDVRDRLPAAAGAGLDPLFLSLEEDFAVLTDLLAALPAASPIERKMLTLDYHLLRIYFRVARKYSDSSARKALAEMTSILGFLACSAAGENS